MKFKQYKVRIDGHEGKFNAVVNHAEKLGYKRRYNLSDPRKDDTKVLWLNKLGQAVPFIACLGSKYGTLSTEQFLELTKDDVIDKPETITLYRYTYQHVNGEVVQSNWKTEGPNTIIKVVKTETKEVEID